MFRGRLFCGVCVFEGETSDTSAGYTLMVWSGGCCWVVRPAGSCHTIGVLREHTVLVFGLVWVVSDLAAYRNALVRCPVVGCGDAAGCVVCVV